MGSGAHQSDSAIHTHVSSLPNSSLTSRLPYNIEHSFPPAILVDYPLLKYSSVCMLIPNSLIILSLILSLLVTITSFSKSVSLLFLIRALTPLTRVPPSYFLDTVPWELGISTQETWGYANIQPITAALE